MPPAGSRMECARSRRPVSNDAAETSSLVLVTGAIGFIGRHGVARYRGSFLFDFGQFLPDLSVGGALGIIDLDELPPHHALGVNDVSGRMRPAPAVGVEYAVAIDDSVVFVF